MRMKEAVNSSHVHLRVDQRSLLGLIANDSDVLEDFLGLEGCPDAGIEHVFVPEVIWRMRRLGEIDFIH